MHLVALEPGEALFLPPGVRNSYLCGVAVELMTNSDNVVRAGLTNKSIDVDELLNVLDCRSFAPGPVSSRAGNWVPYLAADELFRLDVAHLAPKRTVRSETKAEPALLLVTAGTATFRVPRGGQTVALGPTQAASVPACVPECEIEGNGTIFRALAGGPAAQR